MYGAWESIIHIPINGLYPAFVYFFIILARLFKFTRRQPSEFEYLPPRSRCPCLKLEFEIWHGLHITVLGMTIKRLLPWIRSLTHSTCLFSIQQSTTTTTLPTSVSRSRHSSCPWNRCNKIKPFGFVCFVRSRIPERLAAVSYFLGNKNCSIQFILRK